MGDHAAALHTLCTCAVESWATVQQRFTRSATQQQAAGAARCCTEAHSCAFPSPFTASKQCSTG
eukprot:scaffold275815_cov24-Tisochrysis_lutea.AAC.1